MKSTIEKKPKTYRISQSQYLEMRRDKRAKKEIKMLALMLFNKVKNWNDNFKEIEKL